MEIWLDAHISPLLAKWIQSEFSIKCFAVREMHLRDAEDAVIFNAAKQKGNVIIMTKDDDYRDLLNRLKAPPKVIWLTFGNCSNKALKEVLKKDLLIALSFLKENGLVEISR